MQMKLKVQSIKWDEDGKVMTLTYAKINKAVVINTALFQNQARAAQHGYTQRFGDLESGDKTGQAKYEAALKLKQHYEAGGDWSMDAERDTLTEVLEAMARITGKYTVEQLRAAAEADPDQVADWRADARVKAEVAKARAKKAADAAKVAPKDELVIKGL